VSGSIAFTDADLADTHVASVAAQGAGYVGALTLGALRDSTGGVTGSVGWIYSVPDGALDFLAAGQTVTQTYNVTITDSQGGATVQVVTVTLTGSNDPTVIVAAATTASGSVAELAATTASVALDAASGKIAFTDADLADSHVVVSIVPQAAGYLGSFVLGPLSDSTGGVIGSVAWSFTVKDGALDFLAAGQTLTQSYDVTLGDLHTGGRAVQTVTITLVGANDVPVIAGVKSGAVTEDVAVVAGNLAASGTLTIADADLGQSSFVAQASAAGSFGTFTLDAA
jgi:VCBS repeat-containing protein